MYEDARETIERFWVHYTQVDALEVECAQPGYWQGKAKRNRRDPRLVCAVSSVDGKLTKASAEDWGVE